ncbi:MAG: hypothetical protein PVH85_31130 [Desulfobacterales bacterium]|jgi:hypothetical protein
MNRRIYTILFIILMLSLPYTYGGCVLVFSSGDVKRDKDPEDDESPTVFTGNTSPAVIDSTNAKDLSSGALAGGMTRLEAESAGHEEELSVTQLGTFWPFRLPMVLMDSIRKAEITGSAAALYKPAVETRSGTLAGSCGGNLSYLIDIISESRLFNGNFRFENYCDHGIAISGETDFDGTYGIGSGDIRTAHFYFADLSDGEVTLDGDMSLDFLYPPTTVTFSAYSKDIESEQVYWIKDYAMNLNEFAGYLEIDIFGAFYHPDHGYVNLTTTEPFIVHHEDDWPTSGLLEIEGQKNTQAELTALNQLTYSVAADTDGNGVFDWDSRILNWTE